MTRVLFAIPCTIGAQNVAGSTTPGAEPVPGLPALGRQVTSPQDLHDEDMDEGKVGGGQGSGDAAAGGGASSPFTFRIGGAAEVSEGCVELTIAETHEGRAREAHVGLAGGSRQHFTTLSSGNKETGEAVVGKGGGFCVCGVETILDRGSRTFSYPPGPISDIFHCPPASYPGYDA